MRQIDGKARPPSGIKSPEEHPRFVAESPGETSFSPGSSSRVLGFALWNKQQTTPYRNNHHTMCIISRSLTNPELGARKRRVIVIPTRHKNHSSKSTTCQSSIADYILAALFQRLDHAAIPITSTKQQRRKRPPLTSSQSVVPP